MGPGYLLEYACERAGRLDSDDLGLVVAAVRVPGAELADPQAWEYRPIVGVELDAEDASLDLLIGSPDSGPVPLVRFVELVREVSTGREDLTVYVCTSYGSGVGHGYREDVPAVALNWHGGMLMLAVAQEYDGWQNELFAR